MRNTARNRSLTVTALQRAEFNEPRPSGSGCCHVMLVTALLFSASCHRGNDQELLTQHRNLGKAYYENPATAREAVREFQQALRLAPNSAREKVNYALALLRAAGRDEEAAQLFLDVQRQDPSLPHTWFNLGIYYKRQGDLRGHLA